MIMTVIYLLTTFQITMRGAERPLNIQWTHPFLEPLRPLTQEAARRTFMDIADSSHDLEEVDKILLLVDNMPLAIELIAHLVDSEGVLSVLERWDTEKTSLLSEGHNKGSNLDLSISLSLRSTRLACVPRSQDLLGLLSILPDGLSDTELLQSQLPIDNIHSCKAALLQTSLAYKDNQNCLKVLVPIREYMQKMHPPTADLAQTLLHHFNYLLNVDDEYRGTISNSGIAVRIRSNMANIQAILIKGLAHDNPDLINTIYSICSLDTFSQNDGHGRFQLVDQIPQFLPQPKDHRLEVYVLIHMLRSYLYQPVNGQQLVDQALEYFQYFDDVDLKCRPLL
jgi:hypothetical protein